MHPFICTLFLHIVIQGIILMVSIPNNWSGRKHTIVSTLGCITGIVFMAALRYFGYNV